MWNIAVKEFRELLFSPKFIFIIITGSLLIFLAVFKGYLLYDSEINHYEAKEAKTLDQLASLDQLHIIHRDINRQPSFLGIFDSGVGGHIGRSGYAISFSATARGTSDGTGITDARYNDEPMMVLFGELDLTYAVVIIYSLFAFLLSYNSISREKEGATLSLIFTNSVSRSSLYIGKLIGGVIPLILSFLIPFLFALIALITLTDVSPSGTNWLELLLMFFAYILYMILFFVIGLTASAFSKKSFTSFMICLLIWISIVNILPKISVQAAAQSSPYMSLAELNSKKDNIINSLYKERTRALAEEIKRRKITREEYRAVAREIYEKLSSNRNEMQEELTQKLLDEYQRQRIAFANSAVPYSRASPTSALSFAIHSIAATGHEQLDKFQEDIARYKKELHIFAEGQREKFKDLVEERSRNRQANYDIKPDATGIMKVTLLATKKNDPLPIELDRLPVYNGYPLPIEAVASNSSIDIGIIVVYILVFFIIGYVAFIRYDVR